MKKRVTEIAAFCGTMILSCLLLSFYFFHIKWTVPVTGVTSAEFQAFFFASLADMAALKILISLLFAVFALFVCERRFEKRARKNPEKKD